MSKYNILEYKQLTMLVKSNKFNERVKAILQNENWIVPKKGCEKRESPSSEK